MIFLNTYWTWQYVLILFFAFWFFFLLAGKMKQTPNKFGQLLFGLLGAFFFHNVW